MEEVMGTAFLIVAAATLLHRSVWEICLLLIGYWSFTRLDQWLVKRTKQKAIDDQTDGWETDPSDQKSETKGNLSRAKLTGDEQIIVTRVAELIKRAI
jgi:hypothetical protein